MMPGRSEEHSAEEVANPWLAGAWLLRERASVDVKAHRFAINALIDVLVADTFHSTAAQAARLHDVDRRLSLGLHGACVGRTG